MNLPSNLSFSWCLLNLMTKKHYQRQLLYRVSQTLPNAFYRVLDKEAICRVPERKHSANNWHSAKRWFAECRAWAVLDWRRRNQLGRYSQSLPDSSKQHEHEPGHTTSAGHFTPSGGGTRGYSWFIHRSLVFSYLSFALL